MGVILFSTESFLEMIGEIKEFVFGILSRQKLDAERQIVLIFAGGKGDAGQASQVGGGGVDVSQIHRQGVVAVLAEFESGGGRGGREKGINFPESLVEILADKRPDFHGLEVIGIIIAGREGVGTDHNAPLGLVTETSASITITEAVIAGQVTTDL